MLMLHISDIHFRSPECLDQLTDPHTSIRTRMIRDLARQVEVLGDVGAILVGGDIAFKADPAEYETARTWIAQLAQISGCPKERIFVIPGNHDVDRGLIKKSVSIQNVQHAVASSSLAQRTARLRQQGVTDVAAKTDWKMAEVLVRLAFASSVPASGTKTEDLGDTYQMVLTTISGTDAPLDPMESARELQVLAAAALAQSFARSPGAAIAVCNASFQGTRKPELPMDLVVALVGAEDTCSRFVMR
jgi:hypothetical protein